ncbi:MAG: GAF domain-containing protein [Candidatus Omnitrophica bacterium]|nr:GAF domain-containing protein [Candidatus Omnitrophota bacterium]
MLWRGKPGRQIYLFSGLTLLVGVWSLFPFATGRVERGADALAVARLLYLAALFVPPLFLHLTYAILGRSALRREAAVLRGFYLVSALFALALPTEWFIRDVIRYAPFFGIVGGPLYTAYVGFFGITCALGFVALRRGYRGASGTRRNQLRYIFLSWFLAYVAGLFHFMPTYFGVEPFPHDLLVIAFVTLSAYAIVRYRILDIRLAMARALIFAVVYALVLGAPFVALMVSRDVLHDLLQQRSFAAPLMAVLYALLASCCPFIYLALQRRAENRLLAEQRRYQIVLRQAAQGMTLIKEMDKLLNLIVHILTRTVRITHAAVHLLDKEANVYVLRARRGAGKSPSPRPSPQQGEGGVGQAIPVNSPLIQELVRQKGAIVQEELKLQLQSGGQTAQLVAAEGAMGTIQAAVAVPSFVEDTLIGFLVLGEKRSGRAYSQDDLQVFEALASQAALAVENAQFYDELQRTQADLFQTAKMASLGQMAGGMSHQINNRFYVLTILAGTMKAALNALTLEGVGQDVRAAIVKATETFQKVEDNAIRGGDIVKTLLRFSRPTRGDQKPVSIQEIVDTALDVVQYKIKLEELDVSKEYEPDLPLVQGNVNQLADSLFNLFSNAYDAIQSKQERLKPPDYRGAITVRARAMSGRVALTIADNGIGMTPPEAAQLFIPFFTTKATSEKGTGLGLFIIKRIIEHHGGHIQATSQFGEGTTFIITLPAAPAAV